MRDNFLSLDNIFDNLIESFPAVGLRRSSLYCSVILFAALIFHVIFLAVPACAREIKVPSEYPSIQGAIDSAVSGDTIFVYDGDYHENLLIEKPLNLIAVFGTQKTRIRAKDPKRPVVIVRSTEKVIIAGFTIEGSDTAGLFLDRVSNSKINGNTARENYTGIRINHSDDNAITGNTTVENFEGIGLAYSNKNKIDSNEANYNSDKGILLYYSNDNVIVSNTTNNNLWNGITVWSSERNIVEDNVSLQNTYAIVVNDSRETVLRGNREMRRIYYLLPVALVYIAAMLYFIEKKLFFIYYSRKIRKGEI